MVSHPLKDLRVGDLVIQPSVAHYLMIQGCQLKDRQRTFPDGKISYEVACSVEFPELWLYRVVAKEWEHYPSAQVAIFRDTYVIRDGERYDYIPF